MASDDDSVLDTSSESSQPTVSRALQLEDAAVRADKTNRDRRLQAMDDRWVLADPHAFDSGAMAYYGENRYGSGRTDLRANAYRYATSEEAAGVAATLGPNYEGFAPLQLPPKPRLKGDSGS